MAIFAPNYHKECITLKLWTGLLHGPLVLLVTICDDKCCEVHEPDFPRKELPYFSIVYCCGKVNTSVANQITTNHLHHNFSFHIVMTSCNEILFYMCIPCKYLQTEKWCLNISVCYSESNCFAVIFCFFLLSGNQIPTEVPWLDNEW